MEVLDGSATISSFFDNSPHFPPGPIWLWSGPPQSSLVSVLHSLAHSNGLRDGSDPKSIRAIPISKGLKAEQKEGLEVLQPSLQQEESEAIREDGLS